MKIQISDNLIRHYLRNVYFITGHSYGAATASLVTIMSADIAERDSIFGYSFATPTYIRHGLTGEAAEKALELIAPNDEEAARTALQSKLASWKNETDWRKKREKAFRFLANRGFPLDIIYQVLDEELKTPSNTDWD